MWSVLDDLALRIRSVAAASLRYLWQRLLLLGWIGKAVAVIVALYGMGWVLGNFGMDSAARSLGAAAIFVLSVLLAWLFIRLIWRDATRTHRR